MVEVKLSQLHHGSPEFSLTAHINGKITKTLTAEEAKQEFTVFIPKPPKQPSNKFFYSSFFLFVIKYQLRKQIIFVYLQLFLKALH